MNTTNIGLYFRVSSELQAKKNGVDAQRFALKLWFDTRGWDYAAAIEYVDLAQTGATMERESVQAMVADIEAGKLDTVVVSDMDRLSRCPEDRKAFLDLCEQRGVKVMDLHGVVEIVSPEGLLIERIRASVAEFNRIKNGQNVSRGLKAKCAAGARWGTNKPKATREQADEAIARLGFEGACKELNVSRAGLYRAKRRKAAVPV